ncbi:MAG TPA: DUF167 domain-containing protein [Candidatus Magasanikbacteria bacterium]|nr:DUF167 domain-containing protein [Candidatus Magasanikbacteria bacterium]
MRIKVKVIPKSKENKIVGPMANGVLKIKITAPATDNKANEELIKFLSEEMKKKKSQIKIISGFTSREKIVEIK